MALRVLPRALLVSVGLLLPAATGLHAQAAAPANLPVTVRGNSGGTLHRRIEAIRQPPNQHVWPLDESATTPYLHLMPMASYTASSNPRPFVAAGIGLGFLALCYAPYQARVTPSHWQTCGGNVKRLALLPAIGVGFRPSGLWSVEVRLARRLLNTNLQGVSARLTNESFSFIVSRDF